MDFAQIIPQLSIDGKPIEHVKYIKFLGILFDEILTWKCHINMVTNKLSKVIGILNRCLPAKCIVITPLELWTDFVKM